MSLLKVVTADRIINLFADVYNFGYLVIGGGNVVVAMMCNKFLITDNYYLLAIS